jgi:hypothetical protein
MGALPLGERTGNVRLRRGPSNCRLTYIAIQDSALFEALGLVVVVDSEILK